MNKTLLELLETVSIFDFAIAIIFIITIISIAITKKKDIVKLLNTWRKKENKKESDETNLSFALNRLEQLEKQREIDVKQSIKHDDEIKGELLKLNKMLLEHIESDNRKTVATLRSTLWRMHRDFVQQGFITKDGLVTFKEVGNVYEEAGGDDIYHDKLEPEIMALEIR